MKWYYLPPNYVSFDLIFHALSSTVTKPYLCSRLGNRPRATVSLTFEKNSPLLIYWVSCKLLRDGVSTSYLTGLLIFLCSNRFSPVFFSVGNVGLCKGLLCHICCTCPQISHFWKNVFNLLTGLWTFRFCSETEERHFAVPFLVARKVDPRYCKSEAVPAVSERLVEMTCFQLMEELTALLHYCFEIPGLFGFFP